jgi:hypothetical protein
MPIKSHNPGTFPRTLSVFLKRLMTEGDAAVFDQPGTLEADPNCERILAEWEEIAQTDLAGNSPPFSLSTAIWASRIFYLACKFVVCRDFSEAEIVRSLHEPCPEQRSPSVDWSADLLFRHLPEVYRSARHLSNGDPLVKELLKLAADWPLSSVGIPLERAANVGTFIGHPSLKRLYVDRILELTDTARVGDTLVNEAVRTAIGGHPELCPTLAERVSIPGTTGAAGVIG